ncbi:glycosyltransferase family 2 protein [Lachnospiraceae bacterium BX10]|jgi:GT2 family glycosyltransferase|uniref:Glycosyltransferase family 2 protein n=1 Tax=Enterocloster hominis (ex Liu et al. 2021) TaxID=2763663 RepID=A0ABR7NS18_9FIRM|nr:glycosyltransferase family 2 protein [Enterocloster hominis]MBC8598920.1 glycosyltransferase family 2 protein [Enterocloster hominis]MBT9793761.1 glycosyltransferase [Clostridium sp. MCC334]
MEIKTTIIIPNYNGLSFMEPCFESLKEQTVRDFKVLVVDNGSTDGSVEWLKEHRVPSIFLKENTGFSGAVNTGIRAADTPYVLLLNNDTRVEPGFVAAMERAMDQSPKIFSVSSRMIQMYHPELLDDAGDMYSILGWAYQRGVGRSVNLYQKSCRVFSACAGAAIYRRAVFDEIGLFDELHFAYLEDIDVGWRAKLYGYDNVYCPDAAVYHVGSGTSGSRYNSFKVRLAARNCIYLNYKNMPGWQILLNAPFLLAGIFVKYLFFVKNGFGGDYVSGLKEGIRTRKQCRRVPGLLKRFGAELKVQFEMICGTGLYVYEFLRRQAAKRK